MNDAQHPRVQRLRSLFRGEASEREARSLARHLESCEECLQIAESIWAEESPFADQEPQPPPEIEARIARGVLRRLHRTELAEQVVVMSSRGFLLVVVELLRPVVAFLTDLNADRRQP